MSLPELPADWLPVVLVLPAGVALALVGALALWLRRRRAAPP